MCRDNFSFYLFWQRRKTYHLLLNYLMISTMMRLCTITPKDTVYIALMFFMVTPSVDLFIDLIDKTMQCVSLVQD